MTDIQMLTIVLTLLAVFAGSYANRKAVEDSRDLLRAEMNLGFERVSNQIRELKDAIHIHEVEHHQK